MLKHNPPYKIGRQYSSGTRTKMNSHESKEFRERMNNAKNSTEKNNIIREYNQFKTELQKRDPNFKLPEDYSQRNPSAAGLLAKGAEKRRFYQIPSLLGVKGGKKTRKNKSYKINTKKKRI